MHYKIIITMFFMLFIINTVVAEPEVTKTPLLTNITLLSWAKEPQIDWFSGLALALAGLVGALVTIFFLIGGVVPGTAGQVDIDYDTQQLKSYKEKLNDLWNKEPVDLPKATELKSMVNDFNDRLNKERWHQFTLAAAIYIVIGAFFATLLAQDMLQALLIGAGWTGYIGAIGLKQDRDERGSRKNEEIDELLDELAVKDEAIKKFEAATKEKGMEAKFEPPIPKGKNIEELKRHAEDVKGL